MSRPTAIGCSLLLSLVCAGVSAGQGLPAPTVGTTERVVILGTVTRVGFTSEELKGQTVSVPIRFLPGTEVTGADRVQFQEFKWRGAGSLSGDIAGDWKSGFTTTLQLRTADELNRPAEIVAVVKVDRGDGELVSLTSLPLKLIVDTTPPRAGAPTVERFPGGAGIVRIPFEDVDLDFATLEATFEIFDPAAPGAAATPRTVAYGEARYVENTRAAEYSFAILNPGLYRVRLARTLADQLGNVITSPNNDGAWVATFNVAGGAVRADRVDYPQFLQPGNDQQPFNPGHRVDTRDVRLYYFRDAHRVAELINRSTKHLNQAGFDEAQRFAGEGRRAANDAADSRRETESQAIHAAQQARQLQSELAAARREQAELAPRADRIDLVNALLSAEITNLSTATYIAVDNDPNIPSYNDSINRRKAIIRAARTQLDIANETLGQVAGSADEQLRSDAQTAATQADARHTAAKRALSAYLTALKDKNTRSSGAIEQRLDSLNDRIAKIPNELAGAQVTEVASRNRLLRAEQTELRRREEQFRREVAAGLADRDTYARGDVSSIDPVSQVTVQVVGTGVLQLRGPINGINKIRRMVHQIDSPVGQVKVGIHTVQINGEHGDRMERVYEDIDKHVAHARFLTNQSGLILRKAVAMVASQVAHEVDQGVIPDGCHEIFANELTDRGGHATKYLYAFFGRDFVDELRRMDSELLHSENKMMSLNSMDTISLPGALNVAALANNDVRQRIVQEFQCMIMSDLAQREVDYYLTLTRTRHRYNILNKLTTARKRAKLDARDTERLLRDAQRNYKFSNTIGFFNTQLVGAGTLNNVQHATLKLAQTLKAQLIAEKELSNLVKERSLLEAQPGETQEKYTESLRDLRQEKAVLSSALSESLSPLVGLLRRSEVQLATDPQTAKELSLLRERLVRTSGQGALDLSSLNSILRTGAQIPNSAESENARYAFLGELFAWLIRETGSDALEQELLIRQLGQVMKTLARQPQQLDTMLHDWEAAYVPYRRLQARLTVAEKAWKDSEDQLFSQRLLDQFIDEQEEKAVELLEALRSHASNVDNYLKRLAIALEDDVNAQFYDPAFQKIRRVSRTYDVQLGQIETTTVLTNNRTFAKVSPAATMEFDLPQRDLVITEAMQGSKALMTEYGNLVENGAFLAGTSLLAGQPAGGLVNSQTPVRQIPGLSGNSSPEFGSALQSLIPDPAVYKFETGTGYEIRPVIQPDGHSIVYDFNYTYTTNVREPVRADEKHLGRVKRHFVHTDVQTSSYELREVSRYVVALKASRTSRGVPLLEDVPIAGALFRPAPQDESSLQENIILASSVIYPTVYDLMGLRWSPYVDAMRSDRLVREKEAQDSRRDQLREHLLQRTRGVVNQRIGLPNPPQVRPESIPPGLPRIR